MSPIRRTTIEDRPEIEALVALRSRHDRYPALSEYKQRAMAGSAPGVGVGSFGPGGKLSGYTQAAWHEPVTEGDPGHWAIEVVVDPLARPGLAAEMVKELRAQLPSPGAALVWVWDRSNASELAELGYSEVRRLERMATDLPVTASHEMPPDVQLLPFRRGTDEAEWIAVNNRAFAGHPENGFVTPDELESRMSLPWFDADDMLLAWRGSRLVGSCWTKVHPDGVGEIYIIGIDPEAQGEGLGRKLLLAGLDHLSRARGCETAMLYTEATNRAAKQLYVEVGFTTDHVIQQLALRTG